MSSESDIPAYPPITPHLNPHGLVIKSSPESGRGVYASAAIAQSTVIEISPVLLFSRDEYLSHGKHTLLDSYTFIWRDKREGGQKKWALALGLGISLDVFHSSFLPSGQPMLGSLFNHSQTPNVSYNLDQDTQSIRFTAFRTISPGEELYICYGREEDLWWNRGSQSARPPSPAEDHWQALSALDPEIELVHLFRRALF